MATNRKPKSSIESRRKRRELEAKRDKEMVNMQTAKTRLAAVRAELKLHKQSRA